MNKVLEVRQACIFGRDTEMGVILCGVGIEGREFVRDAFESEEGNGA